MREKPKNEDKDHIKETIFLIIYTLIGTLVLVFGVLFLNSLWPKGYLLNYDTWGTVSDWFTFLVALIGGVFVYKTLDSQMKVQKDQTRIFKIEELKYIREIRPIIKITHSLGKIWQDLYCAPENTKLLSIDINALIYSDRECKLSYKIYTESKTIFEVSPNYILTKGESKYYFRKRINLEVKDYIDGKPHIENLMFKINYFDCDGNEYLHTYEIEFPYIGGSSYIQIKRVFMDDKMIRQLF
ncbi:hypothetical protein [Sphingobacterium sp. 18053]|uniref:hypothetical protein n=1 Tax=Sphingobacterium sp. 18053 TaxID=2681401 RepID=UPI0013569F26|nr:hypothetical protein [Sphingobacterium sp. 18053]